MTETTAEPSGFPATCKKIVDSNVFQFFILGVILCAAALVGIETYYPEPTTDNVETLRKHQQSIQWLELLNQVVLWIFVLEAAIKMAQHGSRFHRYFRDPWNVFDFSIVVVCFLPVNASYAAVLRLARIMRALRLMTAVPQLQLIVGALIRSIPSMGYVGILLALNFYVYAVMGVFLFRENDPTHFCDLPRAMLTLFRVVTLEDWTDVMYINMYGSDSYGGYEDLSTNDTGVERVSGANPIIGAAYFVSFVMFGTMIMLNLFIGVIINSMDEARAERDHEEQLEKRRLGIEPDIEDDIDDINRQLEELQDSLQRLKVRVRNEDD